MRNNKKSKEEKQMKKTTKRILAFLSAAAMALSLTACTNNGNGNGTQGGEVAEGKVFAEGTELDMILSSNVSWPYDENWVLLDYIEEATGAKLNIQAIPAEDMYTKLSLIIANKADMPDMIHTFDKAAHVDTYATSGAFISYSDNMDKMPNLQKFLESLGETEATAITDIRKSGDGKIYSAPSYGTQRVTGIRTWMYRKDIFEKHGLEVPKTYDELYAVAKKLKELYPDSYPICNRSGRERFKFTAPSWQPNLDYEIYYDFENEAWKIGAQEPVFKEMVEYYRKLYEEGLINPNFFDDESKPWEELMSTDRGFITNDYIVRLDFFNLAVRQENPDYNLALMAPPVPNTPNGGARISRTNLDYSGWAICNTGDEQGIANAFKYVDWMYTPEAVELLSWGKEGETYEVKDGVKQFILADDEQVQTKYGIASPGMYQNIISDAYENTYTKENIDACIECAPYIEDQANPDDWLALDDADANRAAALWDDMKPYLEEQITKFVIGQLPMSEWDNFQKGIDDMGAKELLEIYTETYNRVIGK